MVNREALEPTADVSVNLPGCISWQHPTRDMRIFMRGEEVKALSSRSLNQAKNGNPSEFGGLLWGQLMDMEDGSSGLLLVPEIVPSESRFFNTGESDLQNLRTALEHSPQGRLKLMGFFRSHLREGLCLSEQDEVFARRFANDPDAAVLIIQPFEIGICMAGFFFWEHGRLQMDASELEVPFVPPEESIDTSMNRPEANPSSASGSDPTSAGAKLSTPSAWSATVPLPDTKHGSPERPSRILVKNQVSSPPIAQAQVMGHNATVWKVAFSLAFLALVGLGLYFVITRRTLHSPPSTAPIEVGLQAKVEDNGQIDLSWDQTAPDLKEALGANLSIIDGTVHRELKMDGTQLRFGKLTYLPNSDDVQFYLEVHLDPVHSIAESVRVLPKVAGLPAVLQQKFSQPLAARSSDRHAVLTSPSPSIATQERFIPRHPSVGSVWQQTSNTIRHYSLGSTEPSSTSRLTVPSSSTPISPPPSLDTASSATVDSAGDIRLAPAPVLPPLQTKRQKAAIVPPTYIPAHPIKQILPTIPSGTSTSLYQPISVTLQLEVNEEGKVSAVHVLHGAPGINAELNIQAIAAAKQWKFKPAMLHGKSIPSEHTVVFRFHRGQ